MILKIVLNAAIITFTKKIDDWEKPAGEQFLELVSVSNKQETL